MRVQNTGGLLSANPSWNTVSGGLSGLAAYSARDVAVAFMRLVNSNPGQHNNTYKATARNSGITDSELSMAFDVIGIPSQDDYMPGPFQQSFIDAVAARGESGAPNYDAVVTAQPSDYNTINNYGQQVMVWLRANPGASREQGIAWLRSQGVKDVDVNAVFSLGWVNGGFEVFGPGGNEDPYRNTATPANPTAVGGEQYSDEQIAVAIIDTFRLAGKNATLADIKPTIQQRYQIDDARWNRIIQRADVINAVAQYAGAVIAGPNVHPSVTDDAIKQGIPIMGTQTYTDEEVVQAIIAGHKQSLTSTLAEIRQVAYTKGIPYTQFDRAAMDPRVRALFPNDPFYASSYAVTTAPPPNAAPPAPSSGGPTGVIQTSNPTGGGSNMPTYSDADFAAALIKSLQTNTASLAQIKAHAMAAYGISEATWNRILARSDVQAAIAMFRPGGVNQEGIGPQPGPGGSGGGGGALFPGTGTGTGGSSGTLPGWLLPGIAIAAAILL